MSKNPPIVRTLRGRLDLDTHPSLIDKNDFIQALNTTKDQLTDSNDKVISNIISNRRVTYNLPPGKNVCIGAYPDELRSAVYYFVYNSNGYNSVLYYSNTTRTITKILQSVTDSGGTDILRFSQYSKINGVNVIHRDEGDLLFWTDGQAPPRKINIQRLIAGTYGTVEEAFITLAKNPPANPPTLQYISSSNVAINNIKGKQFEFSQRFIGDDFEKTTFSPLSSSPLPQYDYLSSLNPNANNVINVTIETGNKDVKKIEVAFRYSIGNSFSQYFRIDVFDKAQLSISNNTTYTFAFANDGAYLSIDEDITDQIYNYVPLLAKSQCLANGTNVVLAAITEGYNKLTNLDVLANVTYETVLLPDGTIVIGSPTFDFTVTQGPDGVGIIRTYRVDFTIGATVTPGDQYNLSFTVNRTPLSSSPPCTGIVASGAHSFSYTAILGNTASDVAAYFLAQINPIVDVIAVDDGGGAFHMETIGFAAQCFFFTNITAQPISATVSVVGNAFYDRIYKFGEKYRFGIVYFDEKGRTNGVETYFGAAGSLNDFEVVIDNFNAFTNAYKRPTVNITIQHLPPTWAKTYSFVRSKRLLSGDFFMFKAGDFQSDSEFYYIGIDTLQQYYIDNPNFSSGWQFASGDRLKANYTFNGANDTGWGAVYSPVLDYPILGTVEKDFGGGSQTYIKIQAYPGTIAPSPYDASLVYEVYRPAVNTDKSLQLYYEFGATYTCQVIGGINYHAGQNSTTNPTVSFTDGDVYLRIRQGLGDEYLIQDPNFSDFYLSAIDSNGRAFQVDENAAQIYNGTLVRFSDAFQPNTNINETNRFEFLNFKEYNRDFGDILKLDVYGPYMKVGQKFKIGNVPILLNIVKTADGSDSLSVSNELLNQIVYYDGDFGVGNSPESWARKNYAIYFTDTIRGVVCRLSQDGITPISILYKINSFAVETLPLRTGNYKVYGGFDSSINNYEYSMEAVGADPAFTMAFDEENNAFEGERSYQPEWMTCLGTLKITFKNGELWTHDDRSRYNNFYGTQYSSSITPVFNDNILIKKVFNSTGYQSLKTWYSPIKGDVYTSSYNSQTNLQQQSKIFAEEYDFLDNPYRYAALLRDMNSMTDENLALWEGDVLCGTWIAIKYVYTEKEFATFLAPYVTFQIDQRNL